MATTRSENDSTLGTKRDIGQLGTMARAVVGGGCLVAAGLLGVGIEDILIGLVAMPLLVLLVLMVRGKVATPVRLGGGIGHAINWAIAIAAFSLYLVPSLIFYGASMLLAAVRGYAGCELFAISNWLRRRNDQIVCPIFSPIDQYEARR